MIEFRHGYNSAAVKQPRLGYDFDFVSCDRSAALPLRVQLFGRRRFAATRRNYFRSLFLQSYGWNRTAPGTRGTGRDATRVLDGFLERLDSPDSHRTQRRIRHM